MLLTLAPKAFAGFVVLAARLWSALVWTLLLWASQLPAILIGWALSALNIQAFAGMTAVILVAFGLPAIVAFALVMAAIYRVVLRPEAKGFALLRIGRDELRLIPVVLVFALFFGLTAWIAQRAGAWGIVVALAAVVVLTPLTLVGPAILDTGRLDPRPGLALARGAWGGLMGMNLVTWLAFGVVVAVMGFVGLAFAGANEAFMLSHGADPVVAARWALGQFVSALLGTAAFVILAAPQAAAYRSLKHRAAGLQPTPAAEPESPPAP